MEIIIIAVLALLGWAAMKLRQSKRLPPPRVDRLVEQGQLYLRLNVHMASLGVRKDTPLAFRMARFLSFGAEVARQAAGISTPLEEMHEGIESVAIFIMLQQGVHTLMTMEMGTDAVTTHRYKSEAVDVLMNGMFAAFRFENRDATDPRAQQIFSVGHRFTKLAQNENSVLLQRSFDAWDRLLESDSLEAVEDMGAAVHDIIVWLNNNHSGEIHVHAGSRNV